MIDFSQPLQGMNQALNSLNTTAQRVAQEPFAAPQDSVDLSTDMVNLIQARNDFAANAKVFRTGDEMAKTLLNMLG